MNIIFNNENKRFRLEVKDSEGVEVVTPVNVQAIRVILKNSYKKDIWLDYRYPSEIEYPEIILSAGKFYFEITTTQAATLIEDEIEVIVNYHVNDVNFEEGFKSFTQKGKLFITKKI